MAAMQDIDSENLPRGGQARDTATSCPGERFPCRRDDKSFPSLGARSSSAPGCDCEGQAWKPIAPTVATTCCNKRRGPAPRLLGICAAEKASLECRLRSVASRLTRSKLTVEARSRRAGMREVSGWYRDRDERVMSRQRSRAII